jgi:CheY-like chemotaxis protein
MSHELRTPLNSLLILSEMLAENTGGNLSPKQQEFAQTIYSSGSDLLALINDILDMAKIESGTMAVEVAEVTFPDLGEYVERTFQPVAENKGLGFAITLGPKLPQAISTDSKRLQQVLRNLLSNAFKFTERGRVGLEIRPATEGWSPDHPVLSRADQVVAFAVSDTGIGIAPDKRLVIFEPFQQADMGTGRKYGGTGLGLSISREISRLLGGEITVQSVPDKGSTFTLYLPRTHAPAATRTPAVGSVAVAPVATPVGDGAGHSRETAPAVPTAGGDQDIQRNDRILLIVEDDPKFAEILLNVAHEKGFKGLITASGENALELAKQYRPDAITLDLRLPDLDGWVVLDRLKHNAATRHIPVHIMSVDDQWKRGGSKRGAFAYLIKPVSLKELDQALGSLKNFIERQTKRLLVVEDNEAERTAIVSLIGGSDVNTTAVATAAEALEALRHAPFDCLVLDLRLPDLSGVELLDKIKKELHLVDLPVIVYTGKDLSKEEELRLKEMSETIIFKDLQSLDRLVDETALFLHRLESALPAHTREALAHAQQNDPGLAGKKVLLVDDDLRNIFALTSMLERWDVQVLRSENGREALEMLKKEPDVDAVLMDIMMPEMDGYETMRAIRRQPEFANLPIIALTAKAMKGDREKCMAAGASDYLAKPVAVDQLLSLLRVWLGRKMAEVGV